MIYGFIKENNDYIDKGNQEKSIKQFAKIKGLSIDRYILDNYKRPYCEICNLKKGLGTGSYVFDLKDGDILICSHFYVLAFSYKTIIFLIKTALEQGAKIYSVEGDIELNKSHIKVFSIVYDLNCFFNARRQEKSLRPTWKLKLESHKSEFEALVRKGLSMKKIAETFHVSAMTVSSFLKRNPELIDIYKKTNPYFGVRTKTKLLEKRPFLKSQIDKYIRKAKANIIPIENLLLAEELKGENKKWRLSP